MCVFIVSIIVLTIVSIIISDYWLLLFFVSVFWFQLCLFLWCFLPLVISLITVIIIMITVIVIIMLIIIVIEYIIPYVYNHIYIYTQMAQIVPKLSATLDCGPRSHPQGKCPLWGPIEEYEAGSGWKIASCWDTWRWSCWFLRTELW